MRKSFLCYEMFLEDISTGVLVVHCTKYNAFPEIKDLIIIDGARKTNPRESHNKREEAERRYYNRPSQRFCFYR